MDSGAIIRSLFLIRQFGWNAITNSDKIIKIIHLRSIKGSTGFMKFLVRTLAAFAFALAALQFMPGTPAIAASDIPITGKYFPDKAFRAVISAKYDTNKDGVLSKDERTMVMNMHCENSNIYSIKGIEYFPNIQGLWCLNNHLTEMDLSGNPEIVGIWCSHNDFKSLDFTGLDKLEWVYCFNCKLESINFRNNPKLAYVECNSNPKLKKLDFSKNLQLENLFCSKCGLTSLDVSKNTMLCELDAFSNKLTSLKLPNNSTLKRLDIWDNEKLGDVDISKLTGLEFYNCASNNVTRLDMKNQPNLQLLICGYNDNLTYLNVSKNPRLADLRLECDYKLKSLDLSNNPQLYNLYAFGLRDLPSVNISKNPYIIKTYVEGKYKDEPQLGAVHSYTIEYGGSEEYFEDLTHCFVVDNGKKVVYKGGNPKVVPECYIDKNDGLKDSEKFATRGQAIKLLWEKAGRPKVSGSSRYSDVAGTPYHDAVRWAETYNICFGYPCICADSFCPDELINREDFALMAHRLALFMDLGTGFDYGRTDWLDDFYDIDYYGWGGFTWAIQFEVLKTKDNHGYPHGRMTVKELEAGAKKIFHLDGAASYSKQVNGNGTPDPVQGVVKYYTGKTGSTYKLPIATPTPPVQSKDPGISKTSDTIVCGRTDTLYVTGNKSSATWSSSDDKIATVDKNGVVTGKSAGTATITAKFDGKTFTCKVTVLYKDVTDSSDFWYNPTYYLTDKGVVKGYDKQTRFKPANDCTRAQMVTFIWRLMGEPKPKSMTCKFSDVKKTDYFYKACIWGNENKIVEGYKDGTFGPQIVCARRHAVTFLWRLAGSPDPKSSKNKFSDVKSSDYFYKATLWASEKKILAGYDDGTFRPNGKCLRRQMVTFLYKYDKFVNGKG